MQIIITHTIIIVQPLGPSSVAAFPLGYRDLEIIALTYDFAMCPSCCGRIHLVIVKTINSYHSAGPLILGYLYVRVAHSVASD